MNKPKITINNTWSTVENLPHNAYMTLYENLAYDVPGAEYVIEHDPEKYGEWDGKKHLIRKKRNVSNAGHFLTGLTSRVIQTLVDYYKVMPEIIDNRTRPENSLEFDWNSKFAPYNYQEDIIGTAITKGRGIIEVCTGGGKTLIASKIIKDTGAVPFIFYVLTQELLYQAKDRLEEYMPGLEVGIVGDGKCDIKEINVVTIQTAFRCFNDEKKEKKEKEERRKKKKDEFFLELDEMDAKQMKRENMDHLARRKEIIELIENARGIYFDEAHHAAASTCQEIVSHSKNAYYLYGGTATPERADNATLMIEGIFGRKIGCISASFLIEKGFLVKPSIYYINLNTKKGLVTTYHQDYKQHIVENKERNNHIIKIGNYMTEKAIPTLILVQRIPHGDFIEKNVPGSVFIHSKSKKRKEKIDKVSRGEINTMIATSLADEGMDIKRLKCLIMAGGGKSPIKCKQRVGRVIRICPEEKKDYAIVFDFNDIGRWISSHSNARKKILKQEPKFIVNNINGFDETIPKRKSVF